jgi:hypothetical protein
MFCSFDRTPKILRLYGSGRVVRQGDPDWGELAAHFPPGNGEQRTGTGRVNHRAIIVVAIHRIADSCGYAVPEMELTQERDLLTRWAERRSADELVAFRQDKNRVSIDGLPALG